MTQQRTPLPLRLVDATPKDVDLVADLGRRTFSEAFAARNDPVEFQTYLDSAFAPEQIRDELADEHATFLLAYLLDTPQTGSDAALRPFEKHPLGYCKLRRAAAIDCVPAQRPVELQRMYVEQAIVGHGLGSALLQAALQRARTEQHDWIWLCSWDRNDDANRFYRRHGFLELGEREFVMGAERQRDLVLAQLL